MPSLTSSPRYRDEQKDIAPHSLLKCSSDATTLLLMLIFRPLAGIDVWIDVRIVVVLILRPSAAISPCRCLFRSSVFCSVFQFWSSGV
ncbi:hypothetical protein LOK49_LG03G02559 [Camellia lanceoleosa]|uniref:Uncharacterized protein n=1 Tax=Camellia lanceoleosa TaxID=1840588 RepID=A0ACC0IBV6_9ERIC|nr:hypothetical protein LOK49_LG03G02559 [Camellia lanceoleosa]